MKIRYFVITFVVALFAFVLYKILSQKSAVTEETLINDDIKNHEKSDMKDTVDTSEQEKVIASIKDKNTQAEKVLRQTASDMKDTLDSSEKNKKDISEMMNKLKG